MTPLPKKIEKKLDHVNPYCFETKIPEKKKVIFGSKKYGKCANLIWIFLPFVKQINTIQATLAFENAPPAVFSLSGTSNVKK